MRIFLGTVEVAGYFARLKQGFDQLGVVATYGVLRSHAFGYGVVEEALPRPVRWCRAAHAWRQAAANPITRAFSNAAFVATSAVALVWAVARHDIFIFGFATSFFALHELPLLRLLGKRMVFVFFGSDARPAYLDGALLHAEPSLSSDPAALGRRARAQRAKVARIEKYAHALVNNPPTGCFHARRFAMWLRVGLPSDVRAGNEPSPRRDVVRILHAPSAPAIKGTPRIRAAVAALRAEGLAVELMEIVGQSNERVQQALADCDLVVDQVYSDTPMATLALEAACHGRPTVVAGYYASGVRQDLAPDDLPPTRYCHPDELEHAIRSLVTDATERTRLGEAARQFVTARYRAAKVAQNYLSLIADELPDDWYYDPVARLRAVVPVGMDEASARALMQRLGASGAAAFHVDHNPGLEAAVTRFAGTAPC